MQGVLGVNIKRHVPERIPTTHPTVVIEVTLQDGTKKRMRCIGFSVAAVAYPQAVKMEIVEGSPGPEGRFY